MVTMGDLMRTPTTEERLRTNLRQGLDLLDGNPPASVGAWKDWLWAAHLNIKAHIAELNRREEAITAPLPAPDRQRIDIGF
jgi:hypothetical protein